MAKASARHILVKTEEECNTLKTRIEGGEDFGAVAADVSMCPSGKSGGALGEFAPGQMVPEFDHVCFHEAVGVEKEQAATYPASIRGLDLCRLPPYGQETISN